ncbi:MAG: DUF393 domain-containing protein [Nitrososphaerota archaeon]|nr:DUF393 domain-containing protein [Nitrososphaerota archaeon]MDG7012737.1 DUF393 domain-containing protein [Nitrososphaerota archaeon]MDG7026013.1 DUF393 domain-containing protein [Nitrososphaerota archaeon]
MPYTLAYDSDCGPCAAFRRAVGFLDPGHRMRFVSLTDAERSGLLDGIPPARRHASFHMVSDRGACASGADALPVLASQLPGGPLASRAMASSSAVFGAAAFAYGALSRLHGAGSCARG